MAQAVTGSRDQRCCSYMGARRGSGQLRRPTGQCLHIQSRLGGRRNLSPSRPLAFFRAINPAQLLARTPLLRRYRLHRLLCSITMATRLRDLVTRRSFKGRTLTSVTRRICPMVHTAASSITRAICGWVGMAMAWFKNITRRRLPKQARAPNWVAQIGTHGQCDGPPNPGGLTYTSCGDASSFNTSHTLLNEPADIAVDPNPDPVTHTRGSVYIADGYGNHRVVVFTTSDGGKSYQYSRQWGTACDHVGQDCPAGTFGKTGGGHPHCIVLGNDGLVYVCDRPNSRIQVFDKSCGGASTPGTPGVQPMCMPRRIINIGTDCRSDASGLRRKQCVPACRSS